LELVRRNFSLEELAELDNLSARTYNSCKLGGLGDLVALCDYLMVNKNFLKIPRCGHRTNLELIRICHKYTYQLAHPIPKKPIEIINSIQEKIDKLNDRQIELLNIFIDFRSKCLAVRSLNCLKIYSKGNINLKGLNELIISPNYYFLSLKNSGRRTDNELKGYFRFIRELIDEILAEDYHVKLKIELLNSFLLSEYKVDSNVLDEIWDNYRAENGIPIFKTVGVLISNRYLFKRTDITKMKRIGLIKYSDSADQKEVYTPNYKQDKNIEFRNKMFYYVDTKLSILNGLDLDSINLYGIDREAPIILVNERLIEDIQLKESVVFHSIFIMKILSILFSKTHSIIGKIERCEHEGVKNNNNMYERKSIYLVKNEVKDIFDFDALIGDISQKLSQRIEEHDSIFVESYLSKFLKGNAAFDKSLILPVAQHILLNEFGINIVK
jgi:hypothetical protein